MFLLLYRNTEPSLNNEIGCHPAFSTVIVLYHINVNVLRLYKQGKERLYWEVFYVISKMPDQMP